MRGYASKGFKRVDESDPFYTAPKQPAAGTIVHNQAQVAREAQAEADAAQDLGQPAASKLQDQADALREDLESKGE